MNINLHDFEFFNLLNKNEQEVVKNNIEIKVRKYIELSYKKFLLVEKNKVEKEIKAIKKKKNTELGKTYYQEYYENNVKNTLVQCELCKSFHQKYTIKTHYKSKKHLIAEKIFSLKNEIPNIDSAINNNITNTPNEISK